MDLKIKLYGILVNDKDEILLDRKDFSLPGDDIKKGEDLIIAIKNIIKEKTNIELVDIILFDQDSYIDNKNHILGIFFIGTFYKNQIERINQKYGWFKLKKLDINNLEYFSKFIVKQIVNN